MNREKMMSTAKKLDTFFKVIQRITTISMLVVICVIAVLTVVNLINPNAVIGTGFNMVEIGPITFELAQQYSPSNRTVLTYAWIYTALGAACAVAICYALGRLRQILQCMAQGEPFRPEAADHIRKLAYAVLALGIVHNIAAFGEALVSVFLFGLDRLVDGGQILSVHVNYALDLTFLIGFFLLLLISYIFRYGAELQQLSDETL